MTTLVPMALMYAIQNYEYTYGYTKEGQIYFEEYFPNALELLYRGKRASLYLCDPHTTDTTSIPNEVISDQSVPILQEIPIEDACEALLEQEKLGTLVIRRYEQLSEKEKLWILKAEADTIQKHGLVSIPGPMADYYRTHYPDSWKAILDKTE